MDEYGSFKLNGIDILEPGQSLDYSAKTMQNRYCTRLEDSAVTEIYMIRLQCASATLNSLLDFSVQAICATDGLLSLTLTGFPKDIELDETVLERLSQRTGNLQKLLIGGIAETSQ